MKLMMKGNRQLRVTELQADALALQGYVEVDEETGFPVEETEATKAPPRKR